MRLLRIGVVALGNGDQPDLASHLEEAAGWVRHAVGQGAELVVLPENLMQYRGDGPGHAAPLGMEDFAVDDWRGVFAPLLREAAGRAALVLSFYRVGQSGAIRNSFVVVDAAGDVVWSYDKCWPTGVELAHGVRPGRFQAGTWRGIRLGGAICFDTCFPEHFGVMAEADVDLVLVPSLWPGGSQLEAWSRLYSMRIAVSYPAWSRILDVDGREVAGGGYRNETLRFGFGAPVFVATLNLDRMVFFGNHNQERMVEVERRYGSRIRVVYDQANCLWFLDSLDPELGEQDVAREFGLVSARDYFREARRQVRAVDY